MIVRGTAKWASVFDVNEMSGKYQVDICNLDKETIKTLEKVGLSVKKGEGDKEDQGMYITAKASKYRPKVVDNLGTPMDGTVLIGNGSKVKVQCKPWEINRNGQAFKGLELQAVQVIDLVQYSSGDGDEFDSVVEEAEVDEL